MNKFEQDMKALYPYLYVENAFSDVALEDEPLVLSNQAATR